VIVGRELGGEQPNRGQAEGALSEHPNDDREPPARPCGFNAVVGGRLGEVKDLATIGEERRKARGQVEPAGVELGQVRDETGGGLPLAPDQRLHRGDEVVI